MRESCSRDDVAHIQNQLLTQIEISRFIKSGSPLEIRGQRGLGLPFHLLSEEPPISRAIRGALDLTSQLMTSTLRILAHTGL